MVDLKNLNKPKENYNFKGRITLKLLVVLAFLVVLLVSAQLIYANSLATDGQKLSDVESEIKKLETENKNLKIQISEESSLSSLSKRVQDLGFQKPSKLIVL